jgi:hypothetical protein
MKPAKRQIFRAITLTATLALAELLAALWLRLIRTDGHPQALQIRQQQIANGSAASDAASETIHPWLGWVHNPQLASPEPIDGRLAGTNALGFRDNQHPVTHKSPDQLVVAITGGSVAWRFSWEAESTLAQLLSQHPKLAGRTLRIVRLALPGYKQPQQLFALNYILALGGEFDAVVNIDGFNDSVLSILENAQQGTAIDFPRSWHARSILITDPRYSSEAAQLLNLRGNRQARAQSILQSPLRHSSLRQLLWLVQDDLDHHKLLELAQTITRSRTDSFVHHGPPPPSDPDIANQNAIDLWARCSIQMFDLCHARRIAYIHCLQPSQYLPNSKPFSQFEQDLCLTPDQPHAVLAQTLFPLLQKRGQQLGSHGVPFADLTDIFKNHPETLYSDPWCHVNADGNKLLAQAIAPLLVQALENQP